MVELHESRAETANKCQLRIPVVSDAKKKNKKKLSMTALLLPRMYVNRSLSAFFRVVVSSGHSVHISLQRRQLAPQYMHVGAFPHTRL